MKKPKKTTTKDFLKMDLQMQSGSIWTDEKSKLQKEKEYKTPHFPPMILSPDPVKYGDKEFPADSFMIID